MAEAKCGSARAISNDALQAMMNDQGIKDWVSSYVSEFRALSTAIDPRKQRIGSNLEDFSSPIQVLVVSVSAEDGSAYSLLVGFHLDSQPDGAVYVLGPLEPANVRNVVAEFLDDEIWDEDPSGRRHPGPDRSSRRGRSTRRPLASPRDQLLCATGRLFPGAVHVWSLCWSCSLSPFLQILRR